MGITALRKRNATLLAGIRADGNNLNRLPRHPQGAQWLEIQAGLQGNPSTYRCGGSAG